MINELHDLAKTLENKGISPKEWHREYKAIPKVTEKSPCIRIWLDCDGAICGLEGLSAEQASQLRKYGNNQNSFPAFNISPLYRLTDLDSIDELKRIENGQGKPDIETIKSWCKENNWIKGAPKQIQRNLEDCPQRLLETIGTQAQMNDTIILELVSLCKKLCENIDGGFRASLENCIFTKLQKGEDVKLALALLFHKGSAEKEHSKDAGNKLSVILDVWEWSRYEYPVANEYTTLQLNEMLLANSANVEILADNTQLDAFGSPFVNPNEPMPSVKLSGFEVTLRSMFNGQPCQYRYGQIDDGSYPITAENRSSIKKSLEWITHPSRRHVTWEKVDKNEVAFVYPSRLPEVFPHFASVFKNDPSKSPKRTEARFENVAKEFAKSFRGLPVDQKPDNLQIFTIRKLDKARSKILFTHNTTPEQLIQAADDWSLGCHNIPELEMDEGNSPFPLEVGSIVNGVWKQNGERADGKTSVKCMKYYQGVELLLNILPQGAVYNFLHITLEHSSGLINYLGNLLHRGRKDGSSTEIKRLEIQKNAAAQILSVLGLLLYKSDIRKEKYMEGLAYLIGQLLHVSDELHTLYCKIKRNGDIPPQLAGSALFTTAGDMPFQALSQLSTRLNPYISWAKQYQFKDIEKQGEESWRARWLLGLLRQLSNEIHLQMDKSIRFNDYDKAQLFIGYMASLQKEGQLLKTKS
ncbi:MAG: hypothetical protein ACLSVG_02795 [Clostridia bacterium]